MVDEPLSRRTILLTTATLGTATLAGCPSQSGGDDDGETPTDAATATATATETATETARETATETARETATATPDAGSTATQTPPQAPTAAFTFDYDPSAELVTVSHAGGAGVRADRLRLEGDSLTAAPDADMDGPGPWAGSTGGTVDGEPAVLAGDSVTVGVEPDYVLRVVWTTADGSTTQELANHMGPEA